MKIVLDWKLVYLLLLKLTGSYLNHMDFCLIYQWDCWALLFLFYRTNKLLLLLLLLRLFTAIDFALGGSSPYSSNKLE